MHPSSVHPPSPIAPLPPECLELIVDCLRNDLASLYQLLLVSRQLFELTVPVLYRSPFRLAAGIPDPPPLFSAPQSESHPHSPPHAYDSTTGWAKFLDRTKLLSRLLIQNLQIKPLGKVPRLAVHKASLLDDSSGMESLEPLLPSTEQQLSWPKRSPAVNTPSGWSQSCSALSLDHDDRNDNRVEPSAVTDHELAQDSFGHCPDLIRFDDEWGAENDGWSASHRRMGSQQGTTGGSGAACYNTDHDEDRKKDSRIKRQDQTTTGTGLLMDYFYFYSHVDHRSIASVIRHVYPGAGRRECDRFMAEIERAVLLHNPGQIVSIHVQCPSVVIPHLLANMDQFQQISSIELLDAVWTIHELEIVYQFLSEHAAMFPAGNVETEEKEVGGGHHERVIMKPLAIRQGIRRRTAAIRQFKYTTIRNHWDETTLGGQRFDPLQLIKALGPGLEIIESVHWPRTTLQDLDSLDVGSLHTLRIGFLDTPREGTVVFRMGCLPVKKQQQQQQQQQPLKGRKRRSTEQPSTAQEQPPNSKRTKCDSTDQPAKRKIGGRGLGKKTLEKRRLEELERLRLEELDRMQHEELERVRLEELERARLQALELEKARLQDLERTRLEELEKARREEQERMRLEALAEAEAELFDGPLSPAPTDLKKEWQENGAQEEEFQIEKVVKTQEEDYHIEKVVKTQEEDYHIGKVVKTQEEEYHIEKVVKTQEEEYHIE
ncbi:hypothetical protein EC968_007621 [Mortierella alpina]|nr:hypothetical protein EC968_007621 [Mortierella alpina]